MVHVFVAAYEALLVVMAVSFAAFGAFVREGYQTFPWLEGVLAAVGVSPEGKLFLQTISVCVLQQVGLDLQWLVQVLVC